MRVRSKVWRSGRIRANSDLNFGLTRTCILTQTLFPNLNPIPTRILTLIPSFMVWDFRTIGSGPTS